MMQTLVSAWHLLIVIVGFGLVIVIHELGHFLAAKWAGIRVHEFAVGFGPAIGAWRKGLGFRRGSTAAEYDRLVAEGGGANVSPTEYRLNWLPLGGYVKMLGQEDLAPVKEVMAPDSYQSKPVWKRMVVVSAGVVMNLILAALLFIVVFMVGLRSPAPVIGAVRAGSAASVAVAEAPADVKPGLRAGDEIVRIGDRNVKSFRDVSLAASMARKGAPLEIVVRRPDVAGDITFRATPRESDETKLLELGLTPARSDRMWAASADAGSDAGMVLALRSAGMDGVAPGSRLVEVNGRPAEYAHALEEACEASRGEPVEAVFEKPSGERVSVTVRPQARLQTAEMKVSERVVYPFRHLLGLCPATTIGQVGERAAAAGLRPGDIVARVGSVVWPETLAMQQEVKKRAGKDIELRVLRDGEYVTLTAGVDKKGRIGVGLQGSAPSWATPSYVVRPPAGAEGLGDSPLLLPPGVRVLGVNGRAVSTWQDLRESLRAATDEAAQAGSGATVQVAYRLPLGDAPDSGPVEEIAWTISPEDVEAVRLLGWESPLEDWIFMPAEVILESKDPLGALVMGVSETHRIVMTTYLTFVRLAQGSVKVEHLKGPVGIADVGTTVIRLGFINLLFFLAIVSANLAVINFLPLPIVDGGLFVFLLIEGATRKPVSVRVQNAATALGVLLIGAVFLVVTFNDIRNLIAP